MIDLCTNCTDPGPDECETLCSQAEEWAEQDQIELDPQYLAYVTPAALEYIAHKQTLTHAEMQTDVRLGIQEWHYVKQAKLTDQQMQVTWLYYWEKLTMKEIAKKLSISEPTVHQHLEYAKKKLIKLLKPE